MTKVTKKARIAFVKQQLTQPQWAVKALIKVYDLQTEDEQVIGETQYHNTVGFTGADARLLTSFAKQYLRRRSLSPKQMTLVLKKMPKYHRQVLEMSDLAKLDKLILKNQL